MSNASDENPSTPEHPMPLGPIPLMGPPQSPIQEAGGPPQVPPHTSQAPPYPYQVPQYPYAEVVGAAGQPTTASRYPSPVECQTCGCTPAMPVTIRRLFGTIVTGIFFWQTRRGPYCQLCGLAEYNTGQHITATIGICGPIAIFIAGPFLLLNRKARQQLERMPGPANRDPNVYTGARTTPRNPGKPVARRITAYLPILAILAIVLVLFSNPTLGMNSPQELKAKYTGTCWNDTSSSGKFVEKVPCTADAQYVAVAVVPTDADCPDGTNKVTDIGTELVACLVNQEDLDPAQEPTQA